MIRVARLSAATLAIALLAILACEQRRDIIGAEEKRYSQYNEELIVRDFFQDRRDGVFLDVGCAFPIKGSTTAYLEKHLGWSGIGVDALDIYETAWEHARPNSRFRTYLVGDHSGTVETFYRAGAPGLSSTIQDREFDGRKLNQTEVRVPTITLDDLLEQEGIDQIDFLSMDIEEAEPAALRGFDIERYAPELVCIEASPSIRAEIQAYFAEHGYVRIDEYLAHDSVNWYYTPAGS